MHSLPAGYLDKKKAVWLDLSDWDQWFYRKLSPKLQARIWGLESYNDVTEEDEMTVFE